MWSLAEVGPGHIGDDISSLHIITHCSMGSKRLFVTGPKNSSTSLYALRGRSNNFGSLTGRWQAFH